MTGPHNREAEEAVIGAVLLTGLETAEALMVERGLRAEHFHHEPLRAVWRAIVRLVDAGRKVDGLTIADELEAAGELALAGGRGGVDALAGAAPAAGNAGEYAEIVVRLARFRRMVAAGRELVAAGMERDEARAARAEALLGATERGVDALVSPDAAAEWAFRFLSGRGVPEGTIELPWPGLNYAFAGGLRPGTVTLVAAWSHRGKSCVVDGVLEHAAQKGARAALYINEMSPDERTLRFVASLSGVPLTSLLERSFPDEDASRVLEGIERFRALRIPMVRVAGWPVEDIARHIRRSGWDVCAIDLLGRIPSPPGEPRTVAVDRISRVLNDVALQANCHLLVVCQLNRTRNVEAKAPTPTGRDIRESGALYNDASNVLLLHREQEEVVEGAGVWEDTNDAVLFTDKVRNGPGGSVRAVFNPRRMRFVEAVA